METPHAQTWEDALDTLEVHLNRAAMLLERLEPEEVLAWELPELDGPMPAYLLPRARALLERQQRVIDAIPDAMTRTRRQEMVTRRIGDATRPSRLSGTTGPARYVDITA